MSFLTRFPIAGSSVVVTGAGSGIGRAFAVRMSRAGSPVVLIDRDQSALDETADLLGGQFLTRALDVRDGATLHEFAWEVARWTPRPIGVVFNNAGVWLAQTAADASDEDEEWLHGINFHGVVNGVKAFLPVLLDQGSGCILNTSSVFALMGVPKQTMYCASKFAVRGYTEALHQELRGSGVRAVTVYPGGTNTNMIANGRALADPADLGRDAATLTLHHAGDSMTTPEGAAKTIQRGLERGRSRILIGPDAHLTDLFTRISPTHAFTVLETLHAQRLRRVVARRPA